MNISKNIKRWSAFQKEAEFLENLPYTYVTSTVSASGDPNLTISIKNKNIPLHSEHNPKEEAQTLFDSLDIKGINVIFVYGVGLGYFYDCAKEWLRKSPDHYLVFLENSLEVIKKLFETERGSQILFDQQVWLVNLDPEGRLMGHLAATFVLKPYLFVVLDSYKEIYGDASTIAKARLDYHLSMRLGFITEYSNHGSAFNGNFFRNLVLLPQAYSGNKFYGKFQNIPAIICGAGPSLAKNIHLLEKLRDKAIIFAGATAMNAVNASGILPHFGVGIDPNTAQFTRLIMNQAYEVPYFYKSRFLNEALKIVHGDHLFVTGSTGFTVSNWFENKLQISGLDVQEGHNVVNLSTSIALAMGCNPILFVGLDLAYTDMHSYASGVINHPLHNLRENFKTKALHEELVKKEDIFGEPTLTLWKWIAESSWYTDLASKNPNILFINATEGGIGFAGIPNMTLQTASETLLKVEYDLDGLIEQVLQQSQFSENVNSENIQKAVIELKESLERCATNIKIIQEEYEKLEREEELPSTLMTETGIKSLIALEQEIAYENCLKVFNDNFDQVLLKDFSRLEYDRDILSEKEFLERKLALSKNRFGYLAETTRSIIWIINRILEETAEQKPFSLSQFEKGETPKIPTFPHDTYSFENGTLRIVDPELDLSIEQTLPNPQKVETFYPTGKIKSVQYYQDGHLVGPSTFFDQDGTILSQTWFLNGKRVGKAWKYHRGGSLHSLQRFKEGIWEGLQEYYYPNGVLKSHLPYSKGRLEGDVSLFYPDGKKRRDLHYVQGKRKGFERIWNSMGLLIIEAEFDMDRPVGTARRWYANGNLGEEVVFAKDSPIPTYREWDKSGQLLEKSTAYKYDYFDQVAVQSNQLTNAIENVVQNMAKITPLIETTVGKGEKTLHTEIQALAKELNHMKEINKELLFETGLDPTNPEEAIWKSPESKKEIEKQIDFMTKMMSDEMSHIQNALVKTLGLLSKKISVQEKDEK